MSHFSDFVTLVSEILDQCKCPRFVMEIDADHCGMMYFGINDNSAFLSHNPVDLHPPYLVGLNQEFVARHPANNNVVELDYLGESTEFYVKTFIPMNVAMDVLKEFWEQGILSNRIEWEEV